MNEELYIPLVWNLEQEIHYGFSWLLYYVLKLPYLFDYKLSGFYTIN